MHYIVSDCLSGLFVFLFKFVQYIIWFLCFIDWSVTQSIFQWCLWYYLIKTSHTSCLLPDRLMRFFEKKKFFSFGFLQTVGLEIDNEKHNERHRKMFLKSWQWIIHNVLDMIRPNLLASCGGFFKVFINLVFL